MQAFGVVGTEIKSNDLNNLFNKILQVYRLAVCPPTEKDTEAQEVFHTLNRPDQKRTFPQCIVSKAGP